MTRKPQAVRRPNIIFILIDDMGWKDLGCYGSTFYETPNIDRLAVEGMRFTDAYAACPVCSPTRASILSGRYPARVGVTNFIGGHTQGRLIDAPYIRHLPHTEYSLARALKAGGYKTWHVGKWHLGEKDDWPERHGFDVNIGGCGWGAPRHGYFSPYNCPTLADGPDGEYLTDRLTDEAIRLIESNDGTPFFLNFWHYAVHIPIQVKRDDLAKYEAKAKRLKLDRIDPFEEGELFPCEHKKDEHVIRRKVQSDPAYAAMVDNLDGNIGRLVEAVERAGLADDTVFIFTSDNGGLATAEGSPTCNAPLAEGKGWMYDGGVREPLIVKWPGGTLSGGVTDAPVITHDLYPTILEMTGTPDAPDHICDGESIVPILKDPAATRRSPLFWHYPHYHPGGATPYSAVRDGDWRLVQFFEDDRVELYNLRQDPQEGRDLAALLPEKAEELKSKLEAWRVAVGAQLPTANPDYDPAAQP